MELISGIGKKLLLCFLAIAIVPIVFIGAIAYQKSHKTLQEDLSCELFLIARNLQAQILDFLKEGKLAATFLSSDEFIKDYLIKVNNKEPGFEGLIDDLNEYLSIKNTFDPAYNNIFILNPNGKVAASSKREMIGKDRSQDACFIKGKDGVFVADAYQCKETGMELLAFSAPLLKELKVGSGDSQPALLGVMVIAMKFSELNNLIIGEKTDDTVCSTDSYYEKNSQNAATEGCPNSICLINTIAGKAYIINKDKLIINKPRSTEDAFLKQVVDTEPVRKALTEGKEMIGIYENHRGIPVIGASKCVSEMGWVLLFEMKLSDSFANLTQFKRDSIIIGGVSIFFVVFIALFVSHKIANPIRSLVVGTNKIASGDLKNRAEIVSSDETGLLAYRFNNMAEALEIKITEQKKVEEELRMLNESLREEIIERKQAQRRLSVQYAVARVLAEAARLEEVSTKILQAVCESLEWDVGEIWVFDEQVNVLRCEKAWHVPSLNVSEFEAITKEITFKPGVGLPGRVWTNAKPAWIADVVQDESFLRAPYAAKDEIHGAFAFPIMSGSERLGVMTFFSHDIQEPDETLLEMMGAIGSQIGQFMKRKRAEEEIHYLKEYLETILGSLDVYVRVVNPKLGVEYENPQLKKKFGDGVGKPCYLIWQCNLPCENCTSERAIQTNRVQRKEETLPGGQSYSVTSVPLQTREGTPAAIEIIYDITRLKQNEYEIRSLASRILSAQENERKRISRELHDETGQALTAINLNLIMIEKNFTKDVQNTKKTLSSSKKMLSQIMKDIKQLSYDLRPAMLDDFGLVPAMQSYAREFTERTGISITVKSELVELRFPQEVEISLYRILQEALTNVVKHSKAKNVVIELYIENNKLIMKVEDDGRGFDTDNVLKKVKITNSSTPVSSRHKKENRLA